MMADSDIDEIFWNFGLNGYVDKLQVLIVASRYYYFPRIRWKFYPKLVVIWKP